MYERMFWGLTMLVCFYFGSFYIFQCQYLNAIKKFFAISSAKVHSIKGDSQSVPNCGQYIENKLCGGYNKRFS